MELRKACALIVKPIVAAALVGVLVVVLRSVIPRENLGQGPVETALSLLWASLCISLLFQDARRPNALVRHAAVGLAAGLVMEFLLVRQSFGGPWANDARVADWRVVGMESTIMGLIASLAGIAVGTVRRSGAGRPGRSAKWCDVALAAKDFDASPFVLLTGRRLLQVAVFGAGLVVIFLLVVVDPPVVDSRRVADTLSLGAAAEARAPAPVRSRLVDAAGVRELSLSRGSRIRDLRFSADGRTLRTVDADDSVCFWDATHLAFVRRVSIPAGYAVGSIRPSDGRYALCYDKVDPTRPVRVVDLENGEPICEARLPFAWKGPAGVSPWAHAGNVYWIGDSEVVCTERFLGGRGGGSEDWCRFNYRIDRTDACDNVVSVPLEGVRHDSAGEVTEDGTQSFVVGGGGKGAPPDVVGRIDLRTYKATKLGRIERSVNGPFGLVPGGKYFHLGLHIYDRRSLHLVAAKDFPGDRAEVAVVTFSPNGRRYAASLWQQNLGEHARPVVLVHETLTRRILAAFLPSAGVTRMRFSQDGMRLAVAYEDGTLELRSLSAGRGARPVRP